MYTPDFYTEETRVAQQSARYVIPWLITKIHPTSLIDVGCGTGAFTYEAGQHGIPAVGVDHGVPPNLRFPITYIDCDLTRGYPCTGFHIAVCLEVAEHLPPGTAEPLINGLARAHTILFSAATPGQPGVGHINCQPHQYWHELFLTHGFQWEHIGPTFPEQVADFYRRNMYLYEKPR